MTNDNLTNIKTGLMIWKTSNLWQKLIRSALKKHSLTFNEYTVLEAIKHLNKKEDLISQVLISKFSGVDISVVSFVLKILEKKTLIKKKIDFDNRKKIIELKTHGISILNITIPIIVKIEKNLFDKLGNEETNFCNSLRLILGRKIRIKAERL